jgi:uncharacterized OB-fold protein/acyl dehydratase
VSSATEASATATPSLDEALQAFVGIDLGPPVEARDPVNEAMIRHWCDAMGDANPVYTDPDAAAASVHGGIVAPPTMLQAWTMQGLAPRAERGDEGLHGRLMRLLDAHGFTSVVATNCEQDYARYLRPGDRLSVRMVVESISEEKRTALGVGRFVTTLHTFTDQHGAVVGTMRFRLLKFRPPETEAPGRAPRGLGGARRPRPAVSRDSAFFWEGVRRGELRIQVCSACGRLRHPPRPMCPACRSLDSGFVVASGRGRLYSYVVHHYPPIPGLDPPYVVGLVELAEGTRIVGNLVEVRPEEVEIGMPLEVTFRADPGDDLVLPQWKPARDEGATR